METHFDPGVHLLGAMPALHRENFQRAVVTPVSTLLHLYPDESV